jgi:hypothetical protein
MVVEILALAAFGIEQIGRLLKKPTDDAAELVRTIGQIYEAIDRAAAGHIPTDAAREQIAAMVTSLELHDAAADQALADKFK